MKLLLAVSLMAASQLTASLLAFGHTAPAAGPKAGAGAAPAEFLQALEGEWSVVTEAIPGPGLDPIRTESREVARLLGGRWLVAESTRLQGGRVLTSILTLGYDPAAERFVATWIDAMQTHLWLYAGALDDSGAALTLETEGPILGDATRTTQYREIHEVVDRDHRIMRSFILAPHGEWFEFGRAEYRRLR
jgi:hypothetical protein